LGPFGLKALNWTLPPPLHLNKLEACVQLVEYTQDVYHVYTIGGKC